MTATARLSRRQCTPASEIGVTDFMFRADFAGAKGAFNAADLLKKYARDKSAIPAVEEPFGRRPIDECRV